MWAFIQNEVLGMAWLNRLINTGLSALGLDTGSRLGGSILFFLYDCVKIMLLLGVLIFAISYIQSFFPSERSKKILGRFRGVGANCVAALLGTVTPFCSCSSIPLFIGFTSAGLPLGVTFSFLISSPMVDLGSLVLLMSIFGWRVAIVYVVLGLVIAVAGGSLIERLHMDDEVEAYIRSGKNIDLPQQEFHVRDRLKYAWEQVSSTAKKVFPYVLIGVGIGAVIHNIAVPLVLQTFLIFAVAYFACHALKLPHRIAAPAGMIGASNFFELAVAVAIALFGTTSPAALAKTVGVLTEVPVMLLLVRIANQTKAWFGAAPLHSTLKDR